MPQATRLGWNEDFVYILMPRDKNQSLQKFEIKDLEMIKNIRDVPLQCTDFQLISPLYNEYFKMRLLMFHKTYVKILSNLSENYEYFKQNSKIKQTNKNYKKVRVIS